LPSQCGAGTRAEGRPAGLPGPLMMPDHDRLTALNRTGSGRRAEANPDENAAGRGIADVECRASTDRGFKGRDAPRASRLATRCAKSSAKRWTCSLACCSKRSTPAARSPACASTAACPDRVEPGSVGPDSVATSEASCGRSDRAHAGSEPEPARPPGCAELLLLGGVLARRVVSLRCCCRAAEEVHFDLADEPVPELGVADAPPLVRRR
jgi:hypothetical protein